jgi:hypothetical protein
MRYPYAIDMPLVTLEKLGLLSIFCGHRCNEVLLSQQHAPLDGGAAAPR